IVLFYQADTAAYAGEFAKARELTRRAISSAQRTDNREAAAAYQAEAAVREALAGDMGLAKHQAQDAPALSNAGHVEAMTALVLGRAGDSSQAVRLGEDLAKRYPEDTIVQSNFLPVVHAVVALQKGPGANDASAAIDALAGATPYELGAEGRA